MSWTAPSSNGGAAVTDYVVQYSTSASSGFEIFSDGTATTTTATVTGLTNGTSYYFKVAATNSVGTGNYSAASATVIPAGAPSAPTGVSITASSGSLSVAFTAGATGGSAITSYKYSTDGGTTFYTRASGTTASPLVISTLSTNGSTALTNGTAYSIQIKAVNLIGDGTATASTSATPASCANGGACVVGVDTGAGGGKVFYYSSTAFTSTGSDCNTNCHYLEAALTDAASSALCSNTSSTLGVYGTAIGSGMANTTTADITCTSGAIQVAADYTNNGTDDWFLPSKDEFDQLYAYRTQVGGFTSTYYWSSFEQTNLYGWYLLFSNGSQGSYTKGSTLRVRLVRAGGTPAAPSAPTGVSITASSGSLSVAFTAGATGGSAITSYKYSTDGGTTFYTRASGTTDSPLVISTLSTNGSTALTNETAYNIQIKAVNAVGDGTATASTSATPIGSPAAPTISAITASSASLSVAFTAGATGGSAITSYKY